MPPQVTPEISIIIPTYNRMESLCACLRALKALSFSLRQIEVIVVDDGSTDGTRSLLAKQRRLGVQVITQENQGQVAALNRGARLSQGEILVFLDDDAIVPSDLISCIWEAHRRYERAIVLPVVRPACSDAEGLFAEIMTRSHVAQSGSTGPRPGQFTDLVGCCFTVKRKHFFEIGQLRTLPGKLWPDWNDVDFAYRADKQGFRFWVCPTATVHHYESAVASLSAACARAFNSSRSAIRLFERHPDLMHHLPMFRDKGPITWRIDPPSLILRKLARQGVSSRPAMALMESTVPALERHAPSSKALGLLYRWIVSGYIYRGYREGLRHSQGEGTT